jgi:hypothetical protein
MRQTLAASGQAKRQTLAAKRQRLAASGQAKRQRPVRRLQVKVKRMKRAMRKRPARGISMHTATMAEMAK